MSGGAPRIRPRAVALVFVAALLVVPSLLVAPGAAHQGRHGFLENGILEAEDYDVPDPDCDPAPQQQNHRHTHTEIGSTPPVGTGVWLPWRGCSITWTDVHFARPFQFTMARAESLHDSHPSANPPYTKVTHNVFVDGVLHASGSTWSQFWHVQYPPPENIPLTAMDTIARGTHDIRLTVELQLNVPQGSHQNYFVDRLAGVFLESTEPDIGPCTNTPPELQVPVNNGMAAGTAGWHRADYRFEFQGHAIDAEGDRVSYLWDWADGSTDATFKRKATHAWSTMADHVVLITLRDDPSDRCTDTPPAERVIEVPFTVTGLWSATITGPTDGTQCTRAGDARVVPFNVVVGRCTVTATANARGDDHLIGGIVFDVHRSNGYNRFASDPEAPFEGVYNSMSQPMGTGYTFRACVHGPDDDVYGRMSCTERYRFTSLWP